MDSPEFPRPAPVVRLAPAETVRARRPCARLTLAGLALCAAPSARAFVNPGFDGPTLWATPASWTSSCQTACVIPASGPPNPTCSGCPYVRVVDAFPVPNTAGALSSVYAGSQAAEVYGACTCICSNGQWGRVEQADVVPSTSPGGACISAAYAGNFQAGHPSDPGDCRLRFQVIGNSGGCTGTLADFVYLAYSPQSQAGQAGFLYLPWTTWVSPCLPSGCTVTFRFEAFGCNYCGHSAWGYLDAVGWNLTCCTFATPSRTPTATATPIQSHTGTATETATPTASAAPSATATATATVASFRVYPNPASRDGTVYLSGIPSGARVAVYNFRGERVGGPLEPDAAGVVAWPPGASGRALGPYLFVVRIGKEIEEKGVFVIRK